MNEFTITRKIEIDASHRVPDHHSKCFNMHGHRYTIQATLQGPTIQRGEQSGMVMDFGFVKECMMNVIDANCDHATILSFHDPMLTSIIGSRSYNIGQANTWSDLPGWKLFIIPEVPTAENLAMVWYNMLKEEILQFFINNLHDANPPKLIKIAVWETPNCVAEYSDE